MRTNAQKLKDIQTAAATRQQKRRAGMRDRGRPDTTVTDMALVEAMSFVIASRAVSTLNADKNADPRSFKDALSLPVTAIRDAALEVLVGRKGFDPRESRIAIGLRLAMRSEHLEPSFIPSLQPDPVAQAERRAEFQAAAA